MSKIAPSVQKSNSKRKAPADPFERAGRKDKVKDADLTPYFDPADVIPLQWVRKFTYTQFPSQYAPSLTEHETTLKGLAKRIRSTTARSKEKLPWLKLARFTGDKSGSPSKRSVRYDEAVIDISGIELDYDGKKITFNQAVWLIRKANLCALLYTSARYTDEAPKWRIVLPTSKSLPPGERAKLVARVNGLFGGKFDGVSFTLSQAFYFGSINNNPSHRVELTSGAYVDLRPDLDATAVYKEGKKEASSKANGQDGDPFLNTGDTVRRDWSVDIADILSGENYHQRIVALASSMAARGVSESAAFELLEALLNNSQPGSKDRDERRKDEIKKLTASVHSGYLKYAPQEGEQADQGTQTEAKPKPVVDLWAQSKVPTLPKGLLPGVIEEFALVQGELMGADPAALAMGALTVCGAVIPDRIKLQVKPNDPSWTEETRQWTVGVGGVSAKKTPIRRQVMRPVERIDLDLRSKFARSIAEYDQLTPEEKKTKVEPTLERIRVEDVTPESAQEIFKDNDEGVLLSRDELSAFFGLMDKYGGQKGAKADSGFWLQSFNGGSYTPDRVKRGMGYIPNLSISILGWIQPDTIRKIVADGVDDGLMQRFNPIMMRNGTLGSEDEPGSPAVERYEKLVEDLFALRRRFFDGIKRFDDDAQKLRRQLEEKHLKLAQGYERINKRLASHINKYDGMFARLCLLWHTIEHYQDTWPSYIEGELAQRVAKFMHEFLLPHAIAFYRNVYGLSDQHDRLSAVAGYILAHGLTELTNRDIQRGVHTMRGLDRRDIESVFNQLDTLGWVDRVPGRKLNDLPRWIVNPAVHVQFKEYAELEREERQQVQVLMAASLSEQAESETEIARHQDGFVLTAYPGKLQPPLLQLKLIRPGPIAKRLGERKRIWLIFNTDSGEVKWGKYKVEPAIEDWVFETLQGWKS